MTTTRRTQRPKRTGTRKAARPTLVPVRRPHPLTAPDRWVIERGLRALERRGIQRATVRRTLVTLVWLAVFVAFLLVAGGIGW